MATRPCEQSVRCPGTDSPFANYSSEAPDPLRFIGISFNPYGGDWHTRGRTFVAQGCLAVCESEVSQQEADLCAASQAYLCNHDCPPNDPFCDFKCPGNPLCSCDPNAPIPDPTCAYHCPGDPRCPECPPDVADCDYDCPGDPRCDTYECPGDPRCPTGQVFYNQAQVCVVNCPDGLPFTWRVAGGLFVADSQILADRMAANFACEQADIHRICLSSIPELATTGTAYRNTNGTAVRIVASGGSLQSPNDRWEIISGSLPPGLTLHLNEEIARGILLDGVPTQSGTYQFTVRVTTPTRDFMVKPYTIRVKEIYNDMGMDQAIYHPTRGTVFGVRGAYLFEFEQGSDKTLVQKSRFRTVGFGESHLAYHAGTDRLIVSCWNDKADAGNNSGGTDWSPPKPPSGLRVIYKINPANLAVEATLDINLVSSDDSQQYGGPHSIISANGFIYGFFYIWRPRIFGCPFRYDPATNTAIVDTGQQYEESWIEPCWDEFANDGFMVTTGYRGNTGGSPFKLSGVDLSAFGGGPTTTVNSFGLCQNPANGDFYAASRTATVVKFSDAAQLGTLTLPGAAPNPYHIRFNSFNGKLYVPCYAENTVVIIEPATDSIVETKTGFDMPFDVVFTPTKVFAVQHGIAGLKEVV